MAVKFVITLLRNSGNNSGGLYKKIVGTYFSIMTLSISG